MTPTSVRITVTVTTWSRSRETFDADQLPVLRLALEVDRDRRAPGGIALIESSDGNLHEGSRRLANPGGGASVVTAALVSPSGWVAPVALSNVAQRAVAAGRRRSGVRVDRGVLEGQRAVLVEREVDQRVDRGR